MSDKRAIRAILSTQREMREQQQQARNINFKRIMEVLG